MFIKLTDNYDKSPIYIVPSAICSMDICTPKYPDTDSNVVAEHLPYTRIWFAGGLCMTVSETPEEVIKIVDMYYKMKKNYGIDIFDAGGCQTQL